MSKHPEKNDYFEAGKPVHRRSYCAFLDVLGFSERIRASYKDKTGNKLLQEFHAISERLMTRLKSEVDESFLYLKSFSDNVLLAHPEVSEEDMEFEFGVMLELISWYQFEMAMQGLFIRGALTVGRLFVGENIVYGEALIDAYQLESKIAVNPIIVLCDSTKKLVEQHRGYYHGKPPPHDSYVLVNADGHYFVDYLSACIDEEEKVDLKSLKKHKDQIENALAQYAAQPAVFAKFSWLSAYHNYFCDSVSAYPGYTNKLKVSSELAIVNFERLGYK